MAQAILDFDRAIELTPKSPMAYNKRGNLYQDLGEYDKAIADFTVVVGLPEGGLVGRFNRSKACGLKGDRGQTVRDLTEVIRIDPTYVRAFRLRGLTYDSLGRHAEALADLTEAIRLSPNDPELYQDRAGVYRNLKVTEKADQDAAKAKQLTK